MNRKELIKLADDIFRMADDYTDEEGSRMAALHFKAELDQYFAINHNIWRDNDKGKCFEREMI